MTTSSNFHTNNDNWCYTESIFSPSHAASQESLFTVGNGYLGVRGYFDEGYAEDIPNTACSAFLNGVYESLPIEYDEAAYGFAKNCHRIIDVPRHKFFIEMDGIRFSMKQGSVTDYSRRLDFKTGTLTRSLQWKAPGGRLLRISWERTALDCYKNIMVGQLRLTALNFNGEITVISALSAEYQGVEDKDDPRKGGMVPHRNWCRQAAIQDGEHSQYRYQATNSGIRVAVSMFSHSEGSRRQTRCAQDQQLADCHQLILQQGQQAKVTALLSYADSRSKDFIRYCDTRSSQPQGDALADYGVHLLKHVRTASFTELMTQQKRQIKTFWDRADILVDADDDTQIAIRFALFHLYQSTGQDGLSSIAAKGVTGSGYDGHYFWDAETYVFPFWLFSHPERARKLLEYRVNTLPAAKLRAREMGHSRGALYAWRTVGGEECSSYFPAGSAQYHINADIAYAARSYFRITGDFGFLKQGLAETILETARIWMELGQFSDHPDCRFSIFGVTGPDEYTAMVNNNYYTNKMAQAHLRWAAEIIDLLNEQDQGYCSTLCTETAITCEEIDSWKRAADNMYFCYDENKGIYAQDDSFLGKPVWDFPNTPQHHFPLLLHYHPLVIYRHQVLKQADVILALLLEGESESAMVKRRCFDYYEPLTTHDSTLSGCVYGVMASELELNDRARQYFAETLTLDLEDKHHNTYYGIHTAAMGGVWMGIVQGFGGLRYGEGKLHFKPQLPCNWRSLSFKCHYRDGTLLVTMEKNRTIYTLTEGNLLNFKCCGCDYQVAPGQPLVIENEIA